MRRWWAAAGEAHEQLEEGIGEVIGGEGLATGTDLAVVKADLVAMIAGIETRIVRWNVGTIIAMTAVFAAIVKLLQAKNILGDFIGKGRLRFA
jgi:hypothetical protein